MGSMHISMCFYSSAAMVLYREMIQHTTLDCQETETEIAALGVYITL